MKVKTFVCNMLRENSYLVYDETTREAAVIDPGFYWNEEKKQKYHESCCKPHSKYSFNAIFMYFHSGRKNTNKKGKRQVECFRGRES